MEIIDLEDSDNKEIKMTRFTSGTGSLNLSFDVELGEEAFKKRLPIEISICKREKRLANLLPFIFSGCFLLIAARNYQSGGFLFWLMAILSGLFLAVGLSSISDLRKEIKKLKERHRRELRMLRKNTISHYEFTDDYFKKEDYSGTLQHYWQLEQELVIDEEYCSILEKKGSNKVSLLTIYKCDFGIDRYDEVVTQLERKMERL